MKIKHWLKGLLSAVIGGVANSFCAMQIAPETFNLDAQLNNVIKMLIFSGVTHAAFYLKQSPLPGDEESSGPSLKLIFFPLMAILSLGVTSCVTTNQDGQVVEADTAELKAKAAAEWVANASGLLQAGVATAVQIGVYSANQDDPVEAASTKAVLHAVSSNLSALLESGATDPASVALALKIKEPYFAPIFIGVANLYSSQYARLQKNGYADFAIELLKALSKGVADGSA